MEKPDPKLAKLNELIRGATLVKVLSVVPLRLIISRRESHLAFQLTLHDNGDVEGEEVDVSEVILMERKIEG